MTHEEIRKLTEREVNDEVGTWLGWTLKRTERYGRCSWWWYDDEGLLMETGQFRPATSVDAFLRFVVPAIEARGVYHYYIVELWNAIGIGPWAMHNAPALTRCQAVLMLPEPPAPASQSA